VISIINTRRILSNVLEIAFQLQSLKTNSFLDFVFNVFESGKSGFDELSLTNLVSYFLDSVSLRRAPAKCYRLTPKLTEGAGIGTMK
jgi:hypothetical protein